ncbi:hypothetical protein BTN50_0006 [Candidatus Enterovibrio altilux]|uniref:Uncharacterized protein n=1 Tax=Candidatus Enterovibrio altilux TaxID=1927128 RepID=A0A291B6C7_9GAMM|nr:hypothetical protein BTN50_0006 [Candidatus Enterovibrio luxaltus]
MREPFSYEIKFQQGNHEKFYLFRDLAIMMAFMVKSTFSRP